MCLPILLLSLATLCAAEPSTQPPTPIRVQDFVRSDLPGTTTVQDPESPVSFELPAGWALIAGVRWGNHETTLQIREIASGTLASIYYQYPIQTAIPTNLDAALAGGVEAKVHQRQVSEGLKDYHLRPGTAKISVVDGRLALSYVADYTALRTRQPMSEYLLRVLGSNGKAEFFVKVPAVADLSSFETRLGSIVQTLRLP